MYITDSHAKPAYNEDRQGLTRFGQAEGI